MISKRDTFGEEVAVQDFVSDLYENIRYQKPYSLAFHNFWAKKMLSFLDLRDPILDNGCGSGFLASFLKGYNVVGLDVSPKMAELAKKKYSKVIIGDSQNLPFKDSTFQIVINRGVIHHLPDPEKGVAQVSRVLKKNGQAVFAEPISNFINSLPRKVLKRGKHFSQLHKNFQERELEEMISKYLKIEKVSYFGYLAYFLLGFPDVIDVYKFFPLKGIFTPLFIKFDELLSKIPLINRQAWTIIIVARKE